MSIVITGGGTGGHLSIIDALTEEFSSRGIKLIYIGSNSGREVDWFKNRDIFLDFILLDSKGVVNKRGIGKFSSLYNILKASFACKKIFKKYNVDRVISVGGYSAAPAAFASIFFNKKLFIHEQNAHIGSLNRVLKPFAERFFSSYFGDSTWDYPVKSTFFDRYRTRERVNKIIFLGGSHGAQAINNFALANAKKLSKNGIEIIHQCGVYDYKRVKSEYEKLNVEVELFDFSKNIIDYMEKADFAISRAGASTIWELVATGLPTLYIPYPYAANDHQYLNAKFLVDRDLAFLSRESDILDIDLISLLDFDFKEKSTELKKLISRDGALRIVDSILEK